MAIIVALAGATEVRAQPGSIDSTFNASATIGQWGYSLAVQPDGKVIAAGTFGLLRLLPDGSLDPAFQSIPPGPVSPAYAGARIGAVRLQPDGRIVVTGTFTNASGSPLPTLFRLHPDGSIDPSFTLDSRAFPGRRVLALQPDGKIVSDGFYDRGGEDAGSLIRLLPDGSMDPNWDARWYNSTADLYSLALSPEGKIYFASFSEVLGVNQDGSRDTFFNFEPGLSPHGAVAPQWDGKVLAGLYGDGPRHHSVRRALANGTDDPEWTIPAISGGDHVIYAVLPQPDDKVLFGGNTIYGVNDVPVSGLARLHPDGSLDTSFGTHSSDHFFSVEEIAFAPDGKIFVAGLLQQGEAVRGLWRLNSDTGPQGIEFVSIHQVAQEGDGWVTIPVRRTTGLNQLAVVHYSVRPGSAARVRDYFGGRGVLVFRPGETLRHIRVYVVRDRRTENYETVRLTLERARGGEIGPQRRATLTILDL